MSLFRKLTEDIPVGGGQGFPTELTPKSYTCRIAHVKNSCKEQLTDIAAENDAKKKVSISKM